MSGLDLLAKVKTIIYGDRVESYGTAQESFTRIAKIWSAYLGVHITAEQVAHLMIMLKVSRAKGGKFHADNYLDIMGYACLGYDVAEKGE